MYDLGFNVILKKSGLLGSETNAYIFDMYLPIIGSDSTFLYLFIVNKVLSNENKTTFGDLVSESGLSLQTFLTSKKSLESIGLINFYVNSKTGTYLFSVLDPETPRNFFNNYVLKGLLIQTIGEKRANRIIEKYDSSIDLYGFKDETASINDSYTISIDSEKLKLGQKANLEGRNKNNLKDTFSDVKFINYLRKKANVLIKSSDITFNEIQRAHNLATLFGLNEETIARLVAQCLDMTKEEGKRINFEKVNRLAKAEVVNFDQVKFKANKKTDVNGNSDVINLIKHYENTSPISFLKSKQMNVDVVDADRKLLTSLLEDFNFSNGMVNCLIDYVLELKNGELSKSYVQKIASTIVRKNLRDTLEVYNELHKDKKIITNTKVEHKIVKKEEPTTVINVNDIEVDEDEDLDNF